MNEKNELIMTIDKSYINNEKDGFILIVENNKLIAYRQKIPFKFRLVLNDIDEVVQSVFVTNKYLVSVEMNNVKTIGTRAFYQCINLQEVKMKNLQEIGVAVFEGCVSLKDVEMPSIKKIHASGLSYTTLEKLDAPALEYIDFCALAYCYKLQEINAPNLKHIAPYSLFETKTLSTINLENVDFVGEYAFENSSLAQAKFPNISYVAKNAFTGAKFFNDNKLDTKSLLIYDNILVESKQEVSELILGSNIRLIAQKAFYFDNKINKISAENVLFVNDLAFANSSISKIKMPKAKWQKSSLFEARKLNFLTRLKFKFKDAKVFEKPEN
ncbi:leucine-rich repeat protein [Mycoplasma sp. 1573]